MEKITIARPYATAAFEYALENKKIIEWKKIMHVIAIILKNKKIQNFIFYKNAEIIIEDFIHKIYDKKLHKDFKNFIKILIKYNKLNIFPEIFIYFLKLYNQYYKITNVEIISACILKKKYTDILKKRLKEKLSKKIILNYKIKKNLIAGIIIRINDLIIDNSIKSRINNLKNYLKY